MYLVAVLGRAPETPRTIVGLRRPSCESRPLVSPWGSPSARVHSVSVPNRFNSKKKNDSQSVLRNIWRHIACHDDDRDFYSKQALQRDTTVGGQPGNARGRSRFTFVPRCRNYTLVVSLGAAKQPRAADHEETSLADVDARTDALSTRESRCRAR